MLLRRRVVSARGIQEQLRRFDGARRPFVVRLMLPQSLRVCSYRIIKIRVFFGVSQILMPFRLIFYVLN